MDPENNAPSRAEFDAMVREFREREQRLLQREQDLLDLLNASPPAAPPPPPPPPANPGPPPLPIPAPPPAPAAAPALPVDIPVEKPPSFDGKPAELTDFITKLHVYFIAQPHRFPNDLARCLTAAQFLHGTAFKWVQPSLIQNPLPPLLTNYNLFLTELKATFGDPNEQQTSERAIQTLRQHTSVAAYVAEFTRLSAIVGWPERPLHSMFYQGLKDEVKDQLSLADRPPTLQGLITAALRADHRIMERRAERGRPFPVRQPYLRPAAPLGPPAPPVPPASIAPVPALVPPLLAGPAPMDLGANRPVYRRLTPEERDRRMRANLCLYCGTAGHRAIDCPTRPARPQRLAAADAASPLTPPPAPPGNDLPRVE